MDRLKQYGAIMDKIKQWADFIVFKAKTIEIKWVAIVTLLVLFMLAYALWPGHARADALGFSAGMYNQGLQGFCAPAMEMYIENDNAWRYGLIAHEKNESCTYKSWPIHVEQNMGLYAGKFYPLGWFKLGLGAAIFEHEDFAVGSTPCTGLPAVCERGGLQITFLLSAEADLPGPFFVAIRHFSTAGSSERNKGHDFAPMIGFRIER